MLLSLTILHLQVTFMLSSEDWNALVLFMLYFDNGSLNFVQQLLYLPKKMLEVLVSILYFSNKVLLVFNQRTGWIIGALASGLAIIYFVGLELYIFCALEMACFCIMVYGALGRKDAKLISSYIYGVCAAATTYLLVKVPETGILEFITSLLFMFAFVNLADNRRRIGWIFLAIAHGIMAYITIEKAQYIFASLQAASVIVSILGSLYPKLVIADLRKI